MNPVGPAGTSPSKSDLEAAASRLAHEVMLERPFDYAEFQRILEEQECRIQIAEVERQLDAKAALAEAKASPPVTFKQASKLADRILAAFKPDELCLHPCTVPSRDDAHPGAHLSNTNPISGETKQVPVCVIPKGLGHGTHMCYPGDNNRYRVCPTCRQTVAVRAAKRHVLSHLGINRKTPAELRAELRADVAAFLRLNGNTHLADGVASGRYSPSSGWIRSTCRQYGAQNVRQMRAAVARAASTTQVQVTA